MPVEPMDFDVSDPWGMDAKADEDMPQQPGASSQVEEGTAAVDDPYLRAALDSGTITAQENFWEPAPSGLDTEEGLPPCRGTAGRCYC